MRAGYRACGGAKYCQLETIVRILPLAADQRFGSGRRRVDDAKPVRITE